MNAPVLPLRLHSAPPLPFDPSLGLALASMWEEHTERIVLGAAMLGEPMPKWLRPEMFFAGQHQVIYQACLDVGGNVAKVHEWLRACSRRYKPQVADSVTLAKMCREADWELQQGCQVDCEGIRELWRRRRLLEQCARLVIELRGGLDHEGAYRVLKAHFKECR